MRINSIGGAVAPSIRKSPTRAATEAPGFAETLSGRLQSVSLDENVPIDLGTINGKPIVMTIGHDGLEWTGGPFMPGPFTPGTRVTPEQLAVSQAVARYSTQEHAEVQKTLGIVHRLCLVTRQGAPASAFREYVDQMSLTRTDLMTALRRLGLDPESHFTINGRGFVLGQNGLEDR